MNRRLGRYWRSVLVVALLLVAALICNSVWVAGQVATCSILSSRDRALPYYPDDWNDRCLETKGLNADRMENVRQAKAEGGPTYVSGDLHENTTWSLLGSPYMVTGDITLFPGYTLTVEPGVEVRFSPNTGLNIRGTLVAEGTELSRIVFTSKGGTSKGIWKGIHIATNLGGKATIKFANFSFAQTAINVECCWSGGPVNIYDSAFNNNVVALGGYAGWQMVIERCVFENNTYAVTSADKRISNSVFKGNEYGLYGTERVSIYDSVFTGNKTALYGGRGEVKGSEISNNGIGVEAFFEGFTLRNNIITKNEIGVILGQYDTYSPPLEYNDIYGNKIYNLKNTGDANKSAKYNWWGTTDPCEIEGKIYDGYDDASVGIVEYSPILTGPQDTAPSAIEVSRCITTGPGGIFKDITWMLSESPYIITENLTLFPGYTLTIQPGVEVRFSPGTKLTIRGSLVAEGTESNRIVFTSTKSGTKGGWVGIDIATHLGAKALVKFANFSFAQTAIYVHCCWRGGPVNIYDSVFTDNIVALGGYAGWEMIVESSVFERNTYAVTGADKEISNSIFKNNEYGLYATERISVYSSTFTGNRVALYGGRGEVKDCEISYNNIGVQSFFEGFTLLQNTIQGNNTGALLGQYDTYSPPVYLNDFINNAVQIQNPANTTFHSPEKITYTYHDKTYTNHLGNYWSDYTGSDADGDGIGDTPYHISGNANAKDNYPLMSPKDNYLLAGVVNDPPSAPTLLVPANGAFTNTKPLFDWTDATDPDGPSCCTYEIQVDNNSDFSSPEVSQTGLSASMFTPTAPLAPGGYHWRVRAHDALQFGPFSDVFTFTVVTKCDVDGDGDCDIFDIIKIARYLVGLETLNAEQLVAADANEDGTVDIADIIRIANYLVGNIGVLSAQPSYSTSRAADSVKLEVETKMILLGEATTIQISATPGLAGLQVGPQGSFTFNPSVIQVTEVRGIGPYKVLATKIDNEVGEVKFVTAALGEEAKDRLQVHTFTSSQVPLVELYVRGVGEAGQGSPLLLSADAAVNRKGQKLKVEIEPGWVILGEAAPLRVDAIKSMPNPLRRSHQAMRFIVEGAGIKSVAVEIFDLAGRRVFDSGEVLGNAFEWRLRNDQGKVLANGVYLYVATVRGFDEKVIRSPVKKLVILK